MISVCNILVCCCTVIQLDWHHSQNKSKLCLCFDGFSISRKPREPKNKCLANYFNTVRRLFFISITLYNLYYVTLSVRYLVFGFLQYAKYIESQTTFTLTLAVMLILHQTSSAFRSSATLLCSQLSHYYHSMV